MPLTRENRHLLEIAILSFLRSVKDATSKELYDQLKARGILAIRSVKQVSMICLEFERKGVVLSRQPNLNIKVKAEVKKACRIKIWRINPNFYKEHPRQSMFTFSFKAPLETSKIRKRRMRAIR